MKKIIKYILIGVLVYVLILVFELCCTYAVLGEDTWDYLKEFWDWYKTLIIY